jgi:hypothetical protein
MGEIYGKIFKESFCQNGARVIEEPPLHFAGK